MGRRSEQRRIYARNLPNRGCVFTLDLPRLPVPAVAMLSVEAHAEKHCRKTEPSAFATRS